MMRAVIFDVDGVLADSYHAHWVSWVESCAARGITITREAYEQLFGRSFRAFADALSPRPLSDAEIAAWDWEKEQRYRDLVAREFPAMPGAAELVGALHAAGWRLGIASSGPRENVDCLLAHFAGADAFSFTVSAAETKRTKPHPEPFLACAAGLGVAPERCVVVEDSLHGLAAGRAAGMRTVGLTGTCRRSQLEGNADRVVEHLSELGPADFAELLAEPAPAG